MDRKLWKAEYGYFPKFPCPRCENGKLGTLSKESWRKIPKHNHRHADDWDLGLDMTEGRFTCFLVCDAGFCGEVVAVSGDYKSWEQPGYDDTEGNPTVETRISMYPKAMIPAPRMIEWPKRLSQEATAHLRSAFGLFWNDRGSCANKLRVFVECLLDQLGIVREGQKTDGGPRLLKLHERIDLLEKQEPGHKAAFDALRHVGNSGSHEGAVAIKDLLVCFDGIEIALVELIDRRSANLRVELDEINKRKGR